MTHLNCSSNLIRHNDLCTYVYTSILNRTLRLCNEECVVNGVTIKPGVQVFVPIYDIHMNPDIYPEPEKFIPER